MKKIIKQVLGIDVAQNELVVCLGRMYDEGTTELFARKSFTNNLTGFKALTKWVLPLTDKNNKVHYVMEATGVYHESFAYFLDSLVLSVSIILPNKISNYMRTLDIKTITDKTAADAICQFGLERKLDLWHAPDPLYRKMRQLTRERDQIIAERTVLKNQLHAETSEAEPNKQSKKRIEERIRMMDKHADQVMEELKQHVSGDKELLENVKLLKSIPGIGLLTACIILAETNNFDLIRSKKQLTSYAGLDVKNKESGTSVKGKSAISKRGNKYLRKSMHLPALCAIRHSDRYKAIFARLVSKHGIKMKASVAVQRKLLEMSYTVIKKQKPFDPEYLKENTKQEDAIEIRKGQIPLNPPLYSLIKIDLRTNLK
jgi:transposase